MREIILDTETTGLSVLEGHRLIEIGCLEMVNRRLTGNYFQCYLNPEREVEADAVKIHGLNNEFLADKPRFSEIAKEFISFVEGAPLVIHNAPFDISFINNELQLLSQNHPAITDLCPIIDTLVIARRKHPGQANNLDALCRRYQVDNTNRKFHGALLDVELLAKVYLLMTGGQGQLFNTDTETTAKQTTATSAPISCARNATPLIVLEPDESSLAAHAAFLQKIQNESDQCIWLEEV